MTKDEIALARQVSQAASVLTGTSQYGGVTLVLQREWFGRAQRETPRHDTDLIIIVQNAVVEWRRANAPADQFPGFLTVAIRRYLVNLPEEKKQRSGGGLHSVHELRQRSEKRV